MRPGTGCPSSTARLAVCETGLVSDGPHLHVGDRVVVHDSNPPYALEPGVVESVIQQHGSAVTYAVHLDTGRELRPTASLIHSMPLDPRVTCPWCSTRLEYPPEP